MSAQSSGGVGFPRLLTITFIALKLTNTIDWSWWWVLSPEWIIIAVAVVMLAVRVIVNSFD